MNLHAPLRLILPILCVLGSVSALPAGDAGRPSVPSPGDAIVGGKQAVKGGDENVLRAAGDTPAATQPAANQPAATQPAGSLGPVDVYLIGGQSNATGQGYMRNLPAGFRIDREVLLFNSGKPHLDSGAAPFKWTALRQASESPDRFGPELGFGDRIHELCPARKIALIKHAHSGTNLHAQWNPGKDAADTEHWGPQFKEFVRTVDEGLRGLREQGYEPTVRGMIWQQGESDVGSHANEYAANLGRFIGRVREQFAAPDLRFVYGYVYPPPLDKKGREIRQAEHDVDQNSGSPMAIGNAFVVGTDDLSHRADDPGTPLPGDHLHFGTAGMLGLGRRMAERMAATDTTAPTPAFAGADGTTQPTVPADEAERAKLPRR